MNAVPEPPAQRRATMGLPGYFPDHALERRADFQRLTAAERIRQAIRLSRAITRIAADAPPGPRSGPIEELEADALLRQLLQHEVEFVVLGGLAVAAHGYVHATEMLDIAPFPDRGNLDRLVAALCPIETEASTEAGNRVLRTRHGRVDLIQRVPGVDSYDQLRAHALLAHVTDVGPVLFAGLDDLVAMKRAAGTDADLLDLARLEEARGG
jgi:hypothetical protein